MRRRGAGLALVLLVTLGLAGGGGDVAAQAPPGGLQGCTALVTFADVTVTGSVTTVRAANANRCALNCANNDGAVNVRWGDSAITASRGQRFKAGATLTYTGPAAVSMISEGANVVVSCTEETR